MNDKKRQIPESLLIELYRFHVLEMQEPERAERIRQQVRQIVESKAAADRRRAAFTAYRTAATTDEREAARQQYLNETEIPPDFRR